MLFHHVVHLGESTHPSGHVIFNRVIVCSGQRLAEENENLRKSLQLAEEALENSRLMHQDRVATMREEFRAETRKIREEHREAREMLERELHQHCNDLAEKCKKYK